jgi:glutamate formiminotransferase
MYPRAHAYSDLFPFLPLTDIKTETETEWIRVVERR